MFQRTFKHGRDGIAGVVLLFFRWIDAAAVHPDTNGAIMFDSLIDDEADFVLPRFIALVMVQVSGVVANLVDVGGDMPRRIRHPGFPVVASSTSSTVAESFPS